MSAGGWGPLLGDEGSATWIGLEAIRAGLRAHDRGAGWLAGGLLLREIQQFWGLRDLGELVGKANRRPRPDFGELAAAVVGCASRGDELAAEILRRAGEELAAQVGLVVGKMAGRSSRQPKGIEVAFTGSVLTRISEVFTGFEAALRRDLPAVRVRREPVEPLEGALWRARHGALDSPSGPELASADAGGGETTL
jgi:N-acetylglucosamine kinase-like BadF-type ATPase